jgi:hypothetical protein
VRLIRYSSSLRYCFQSSEPSSKPDWRALVLFCIPFLITLRKDFVNCEGEASLKFGSLLAVCTSPSVHYQRESSDLVWLVRFDKVATLRTLTVNASLAFIAILSSLRNLLTTSVVGGGWDSVEEYLGRVDETYCRSRRVGPDLESLLNRLLALQRGVK